MSISPILDGTLSAFATRYIPFLVGASDDGSKPKTGWSSIIGIVTAIVGNILISFALNTQRYAHIRIGREQEQREKATSKSNGKRHKRSGGNQDGRSQSMQQRSIAEELARKNSKAVAREDLEPRQGEEEEFSGETDALIPKLGRGSSLERSSSSCSSIADADEDEKHPPDSPKSYLRSGYWWLGITLMTLGEAGNFLAYGFAPASIVSPLGVVALVVNCLIAPLMLHEQFRMRDALGVLVAVAGAVTVVLSASTDSPRLGPDEILQLIMTWEFETYLGIVVLLVVVLLAASERYGDKTILIDLGLVGLFGGFTALSTKGVASLLSYTLWRALTFPLTYTLVAVLVLTAIMQIKYVNRALQRFDSTQVIPTQFVLFTISVIVGSAILYRDFEKATTSQAAEFLGGCSLTFGGVWLITGGRGKEGEDKGSDSVEELQDDQIHLIDEDQAKTEGTTTEEATQHPGGDHFPDATSAHRPSRTSTYSSSVHPSTPPLQLEESYGEPSPLMSNPWITTTAQTSKKPPPMRPATSDSILPSSSHASRLASFSGEPSSADASRISTASHKLSVASHSTWQTATTDQPATPGPLPSTASHTTSGYQTASASRTPQTTPVKPPTLSRHSIVGLLPGPLTSPLSSSLSAVIADSLKRGVQVVDMSDLHRRRPSFAAAAGAPRRTKSSKGPQIKPLLPTSRRQSSSAAAEQQQQQPGQSRSFSAAFGDFFRSNRSAGREVADVERSAGEEDADQTRNERLKRGMPGEW